MSGCLKLTYYILEYLYLNASVDAMAQQPWPPGAYHPDFEPDYSFEPGVPFSQLANVTTDGGWSFTGGTRPTAPYPSLLTSPIQTDSSRGPEAPEVPACNGDLPQVIFTSAKIELGVSDTHQVLKYLERYMTRYFGKYHYDITIKVSMYPQQDSELPIFQQDHGICSSNRAQYMS
jgi:hypothetical protein